MFVSRPEILVHFFRSLGGVDFFPLPRRHNLWAALKYLVNYDNFWCLFNDKDVNVLHLFRISLLIKTGLLLPHYIIKLKEGQEELICKSWVMEYYLWIVFIAIGSFGGSFAIVCFSCWWRIRKFRKKLRRKLDNLEKINSNIKFNWYTNVYWISLECLNINKSLQNRIC